MVEYGAAIQQLIHAVIAGDQNAIEAILNQDNDAMNRLGEKQRAVIQGAVFLYDQISTELTTLDDHKKGYIFGRTVGEIGIQIGETALTGGAAAALKFKAVGVAATKLAALPGMTPAIGAKLSLVRSAARKLEKLADVAKEAANLVEMRDFIMRSHGIGKWEAWERVVILGVRGKSKDANAIILAIHKTAVELYEEGAPPTCRQIRELMTGLLEKNDLENHHTAVKELMKKIARARPGNRALTAAEIEALDDMPGLPLWKPWHRPGTGAVPAPKNFHQIYNEVMALRRPTDIAGYKLALRQAYSRFNTLHGEVAEFDFNKVGQAAEAWIDQWLAAHP